MFVDISLDCVVSLRPLYGTLVRVPRPSSLMFPYSPKVMLVIRPSRYGVVSHGHVYGLFVPLTPLVLIGFTQGANISLEAGFCQILFLCAVLVGFHSLYQSTLILVPHSIRPMWPDGLYPDTLFLGTKCWILPRPIHPKEIEVRNEKDDVSRRCFPGRSGLLAIRRGLSPRNSRTFSFMIPYSWEMIFFDISLDCVEPQRPQCDTLVRLPRQFSLMFPYSRSMMIVLRRSLYGVVPDGHVFGFFVTLPPPVLIGFTQEANISFEVGFSKLCFSVLCSSGFTHRTKAPWSLFHLP